MHPTIRRLVPTDHAELRALRLRALAAEPTAFGSTLAREEAFPDAEWVRRLQPGANPHFGGFDNDRLVGLAVGAPDPASPGVTHLGGMWVDPPLRGSGLAAALIAEVVRWAVDQRSTTLRLHLTDGNVAAERLYTRLGFARTGRAEVRERDGLTEVEMEATCPPQPGGERTTYTGSPKRARSMP